MRRENPRMRLCPATIILLTIGIGYLGSVTAQDMPHPSEMTFEASTYERPNPKDFKFGLKNGITVYAVPDRAVPLASISIFAGFGLSSDATSPGAAAVLREILASGSSSSSDIDFGSALKEMVADFSVVMDAELTEISVSVPSEDVWRALELLAGLVQAPLVTTESVKDAIERVGRSGAMHSMGIYDGSLALAADLFRDTVYGAHPYGRRADQVGVASVGVSDVQQLHSQYFVGRNLVVAIGGDIDKAEAVVKTNWALGSLPSGKRAKYSRAPDLRTPETKVHHFKSDKLQTWIVFGHEQPMVRARDQPAWDVLNYVLGGGHFDTRLFRSARDRSGFSNHASVSAEPMAFGPGTYSIRTYGRHEVAKPLLLSSLEEIHRIRDDMISPEELTVAQGALRDGVFRQKYWDAPTTARSLGREWAIYRDHDISGSYLKRLAGVTAEDVQEVAARYLDPSRFQIVVLGPNTIEIE